MSSTPATPATRGKLCAADYGSRHGVPGCLSKRASRCGVEDKIVHAHARCWLCVNENRRSISITNSESPPSKKKEADWNNNLTSFSFSFLFISCISSFLRPRLTTPIPVSDFEPARVRRCRSKIFSLLFFFWRFFFFLLFRLVFKELNWNTMDHPQSQMLVREGLIGKI